MTRELAMRVRAGPARDRLRGVIGPLGWAAVGALVALSIPGVTIPTTYQYVPLVASAVVLGLPHGAVDWAALPRARTGGITRRGVGLVGALYLVLGGAYASLWFVAPPAAAVLFVLLTWFHWGQGDLWTLRRLYGVDHLEDRFGQALAVVVRGGLPMLVPLLGFPGTYRRVLDSFVAPFGGEVGDWWLFSPEARLALGVGFGLVTLAYFGWTALTCRGRGWWLDAGETLLLWLGFLVVPPVLAIGVYFSLWHSARHVARVVLLDDRSVSCLTTGDWARPAARFGLEAAVPTVGAVVLLGGLWVVTPASVTTISGSVGLYLVAIAVLTLPHTVVVTALDSLDGVWH